MSAKGFPGKIFTAVVLLCLGLLVVSPIRVLSAPPAQTIGLQQGDVLAGVDNGRIFQFGPDGTMRGILNTTSGKASLATGMCFDPSGSLYVTTFDNNVLSKFDSTGALLNGSFAANLSEPESCVVDAAGNIYVGEAGGDYLLIELDPSGKQIASFGPALEKRGTDWIALDRDQCTMLYTSEGDSIKRFDVCRNIQLPDFTSQPLNGPCYAVAIRPNEEVMVACSSQVYHLDPSGDVIQTYTDLGSGTLFALNLDPDGTSFWTGDIKTATIFKLDIASGKQMLKPFRADSSALGGLAVVGEIDAQLQPTPAPLVPTPIPFGPTPVPFIPTPPPPPDPLLIIIGAAVILLVVGGIFVAGIVAVVLIVRAARPKNNRSEQKRSSIKVEKHVDMGYQVVVEPVSTGPTSAIRLRPVQGQADISVETKPPNKPRENE